MPGRRLLCIAAQVWHHWPQRITTFSSKNKMMSILTKHPQEERKFRLYVKVSYIVSFAAALHSLRAHPTLNANSPRVCYLFFRALQSACSHVAQRLSPRMDLCSQCLSSNAMRCKSVSLRGMPDKRFVHCALLTAILMARI